MKKLILYVLMLEDYNEVENLVYIRNSCNQKLENAF